MVLHLAVMWRVLLFNNLSYTQLCHEGGDREGRQNWKVNFYTYCEQNAPLVWKHSAKSKNESAN